MIQLALLLIRLATPACDREWVVGDTVEEFARLEASDGRGLARRWLWGEVLRVLRDAPRHRLATRTTRLLPSPKGDRPMSAISQDVKYSLRLLGRAPGFAVVAIATLALGIGANTAMFAVVNAVLLKPLPFRDADRLMLVHMLAPDPRAGAEVYRETIWSYPKYRTFLDVQHSFEDEALFAGRDYNLSGGGDPERVRGEVVTDRYPAVLGIAPILGRGFTYDEANRAGAEPIAMIGYGLWTRRYGGDASILGRSIGINGTPYTVVGVLPQGFKGLTGDAQVWTPLAVVSASDLIEKDSHSYTMVAKRRADVSETNAMTAVRIDGGQIDAQYRESGGPGGRWGATANSLYASRVDADVRRASVIILGAVGFVLLIASVNLTNLLVAKAIGRRREVAIRTAIGATRARIIRQFVVESLLLAVFGALGGLAIASALLIAAAALLPDPDVFFRTAIAPGVPRIAGAAGLTRIGANMIGFDAATLLFTCFVTVITAAMVGLLPALHASSLRPSEALKTGAGGMRGFGGINGRAALVATQIALALVLLTGAGLMVRSAGRLHATDIGVDADDILTVRLDVPRARYPPEKGLIFFEQLVERARALPGVESAGLGFCAPVAGGCNGTLIWFDGKPRRGLGIDPLVGIHWATRGYFSTLGIRLIRGRHFSDTDRMGQPRVALVNEAAARAFWPNADPIGRIIAVGQGGFHEGAAVIGVVSDVRYRTIETAATPDVYVPLSQSYQARMRMFIRSRVGSSDLVAGLTRELRSLDPTLPMSEVKSMAERVGDAMWRTRVSAWLLSAFAGLALLLTAIGVFGVMSQSVAQRTSEISVRMALGAQARDVLGLVLGRAIVVTGAGLLVGLAAALALTRLLTAFLYEVRPSDPLTFITVAVLLGAVALAACYLPARRATRIDAVSALRTE
jgi:putative ABC transport system permease protein